MLYSRVVLPSSNEDAWLQTVRHLAVLTPVLLSLQSTSPSALTQSQSDLVHTLLQEGLIQVIDAVSVMDEEGYEQGLKWLDLGLPVLLFSRPEHGNDAAFFSYTLSQIPRGRVGVSLTESVIQSDENLQSLLQHRSVASQLHLR